MLLYDRIVEHGLRLANKVGLDALTDYDHAIMSRLLRAVVYELTDVVPLVSDWDRGRHQAIPKKPPHPIIWAEWDFKEEGPTGWTEWTLGSLVLSLAKAELAHPYYRHDGDETSPPFDPEHPVYQVAMFRMTRSASSATPEERAWWYKPAADIGFYLFSISESGDACRCIKKIPPLKSADDKGLREISPLCLPLMASSYADDPWYPVAVPWPPFMAFSLMHCKNVVTEEHVPDERTQRGARKAGNPPRCTYKTLRIEVPASAQRRESLVAGDDAEDGPKVRFHLCRGHFKNLQHERFKDKGWHWWPAHWRGSKELGEVHKRYQLEPPT